MAHCARRGETWIPALLMVRSLRRIVVRFGRARDGSVADTFAIAMLPLVVFAGAAIDYSRASGAKADLQAALDDAVLAGVKDGGSNWTQTALNAFTSSLPRRFVSGASATFTLSSTGQYSGRASASSPTAFMGVVGSTQIPVSASSKAAKSTDNSCILALDAGQPSSDQGITFSGSPNAAMSGCTIRSNTSIQCNGHSTGATASIAVGTSGCSNPQSGASAVPDIYAALSSQITTKCPARIATGVTWDPVLAPVFPQLVTVVLPNYTEYHVCGDLTLTGSGFLTGSSPTSDSVIVIENGSLNLTDGSSISTSRVAIVFTGNNSYSSAINFPNGTGKTATLSVSPPTTPSNPWHGISIYQDPRLTYKIDNTWGPGATFNADGVLYFPNAVVKIGGNPSSNNPVCSKFVVKSLTSNGAVNLNQSTQGCANLAVNQYFRVAVAQ